MMDGLVPKIDRLHVTYSLIVLYCTAYTQHNMAANTLPPRALRDFITDERWTERISRTMPFHTLSLRARLDFIHQFAQKHDWSDVCFGALLEPIELEAMCQVLKSAVMRHVLRARAQLDMGNRDAAYAIFLELMRASPLGRFADTTETRFGHLGARRPLTLLGDMITWEWSRMSPILEHNRLTSLAHDLLDQGLAPVLVVDAVLA